MTTSLELEKKRLTRAKATGKIQWEIHDGSNGFLGEAYGNKGVYMFHGDNEYTLRLPDTRETEVFTSRKALYERIRVYDKLDPEEMSDGQG